jgi:hypothetical protein
MLFDTSLFSFLYNDIDLMKSVFVYIKSRISSELGSCYNTDSSTNNTSGTTSTTANGTTNNGSSNGALQHKIINAMNGMKFYIIIVNCKLYIYYLAGIRMIIIAI